MKRVKTNFIISGFLLLLFLFLVIAVLAIDVKPIGPEQSIIGLAGINKFVHETSGIHVLLFHITDVLGYVAIAVAALFAVFGAAQLIKGKSIKKVDFRILLLGALYIALAVCFIFFEFAVVNYRPVILDGKLAASFPSSTTLVTICVFGSAILVCNHYLKKKKALCITINSICAAIIVFTVIGRLVCGVHWFTDIIGAVLLSSFLIMLYYSFVKLIEFKQEAKS